MTTDQMRETIGLTLGAAAAAQNEFGVELIEGLLPESEAKLAWQMVRQRMLVARSLMGGNPDEHVHQCAALIRGYEAVARRLRAKP